MRKRKVVLVVGIWSLLASLLYIHKEFEFFIFFLIISILCFIYGRRIIYKQITRPMIIRIVQLREKEKELRQQVAKLEIYKQQIKDYILSNKENINKITENKKILDDLISNKEKLEENLKGLNEKQYSTEKDMSRKEKEFKNNLVILEEKRRILEQYVAQEKIISRAIEDRKTVLDILDKKAITLSKNVTSLQEKVDKYKKEIKPFQMKEEFKKKCNFDYIDNLDGWEFERFTAELLKNLGYTNIQITEGSGDYGIDVIATKDSVNYAFQCKNYTQAVGNKAIQEAYSGKSYYNSHVAIVITNNYFTPNAIKQAEANGIVLWDRSKLKKLIETLT